MALKDYLWDYVSFVKLCVDKSAVVTLIDEIIVVLSKRI